MKKKSNKKEWQKYGIIAGIVACLLVPVGFVVYDLVTKGLPESVIANDIKSDFKEVGNIVDKSGIRDMNINALEEAYNNEQKRQAVTVVNVIDGDTYTLDADGEEIKARLIGVDTPESVASDEYHKDNTQEGKDVSAIVKEKIPVGSTLYMEYDVSETDKYGRHLVYLYFENGTMVQDWLLSNGYANVATYPPNVKYSERFKELAHKAAENEVGLWDGFFQE